MSSPVLSSSLAARRGLLRESGGLQIAAALLLVVPSLSAEILWTDVEPRVVHQTGKGLDILGGAVHRDDTASDALYFKFHVDPLSDVASEPYLAVFQLFEGTRPRLGVGNAPESWGYSAYYTSETGPLNQVEGEFNLKSSRPEAAGLGAFKPYELPRRHQERTLVFKVQYVPDGDDLITVWLSPDLMDGVTEEKQMEKLTTRFKANASFDQIHLRQEDLRPQDLQDEGGSNGWIFSDMAIATSFSDFVVVRFWQTWWFGSLTAMVGILTVILGVRLVERRRFQRQLQIAERERAVEQERARIAQDLHDELGSSLARISLLSNLVRMDKNDPQEVEAHANKLAQSANQTVRALEEIVWAVRSGSDSLQGLMDYIAHVADEMSEDKAVRCRLDLPPDLPSRPLPPEVRHNIFLVVKEAITNAIKHAEAGEILIRANVNADSLEIEIEDNGRGFDLKAVSQHSERNGLVNMRRRAQAVGGQLDIQTAPGKGVLIRLTSTLPPTGVH